MKKTTKIAILISGVSIMSVFANSYNKFSLPKTETLTFMVKPVTTKIHNILISNELSTLKTHTRFLHKLGHYESSNRYKSVNSLGYMGRYQFSKATLNSLNIEVSEIQFLNNPHLQEEAMYRLLNENYKTLKKYIKKYNGKIVHGVYVTKSGILAAAHLGGAGNVSRWFRKGEDFADANGTKITKYMKIFTNYELDI